ncbi:hypothetical protein EUA06_01145 [Nocardioides glacieisoli]|uniref:Uncharacterized protein n=1 Tax=Nocardioides glacieisoli TaxID=1168730 RepID=A0A4Q2S3S1_9ACTN|nr:hypothetical protein [Nocardioides glacieisoli]RYB96218.1 hypothetical protein EUA06_01145 [Nocardioides glacieisoli]
MPSFRDVSEVAAYLGGRDLPFTWYVMGPEDRAIKFEVAPRDMAAAADYFAQHPVALSDGTPVTVFVEPRRGESWTTQPPQGVAGRDDQFQFERLVGLDVDEAATQASSAGWFVRAHEPEAMATADFNPGRLNLSYGDDRVVETVHVG